MHTDGLGPKQIGMEGVPIKADLHNNEYKVRESVRRQSMNALVNHRTTPQHTTNTSPPNPTECNNSWPGRTRRAR